MVLSKPRLVQDELELGPGHGNNKSFIPEESAIQRKDGERAFPIVVSCRGMCLGLSSSAWIRTQETAVPTGCEIKPGQTKTIPLPTPSLRWVYYKCDFLCYTIVLVCSNAPSPWRVPQSLCQVRDATALRDAFLN